jgi:PAS domain S-box-containing protein
MDMIAAGPPEPEATDGEAQAWQFPTDMLLESAASVWLLTDAGGIVLMASSNLRRACGFDPHELTGRSVDVLVPFRFREEHTAFRADFLEQMAGRPPGLALQLYALRKDGTEFPAELSLSPVETSEGVFVLTTLRDISQRLAVDEQEGLLRSELERQEERERIAMDLHDGVMQEVYAIGLTLELTLAELSEDATAARAGIERAIEQLHGVIRDIRSYIFDLRPRELTGDLTLALSDLAREFQQNSQVRASAKVTGELPELSPEQSVALYHITHEALSNVQRHAAATEVLISATCSPHSVEIEVRDNGVGFDPALARPEKHRGMRNMAARSRSIGAQLAVESAPDGGTCVRVRLRVPVHLARVRDLRQAS